MREEEALCVALPPSVRVLMQMFHGGSQAIIYYHYYLYLLPGILEQNSLPVE